MARAAVIPAASPPKRGTRTAKRTTTTRAATSGVTKPAQRARTTKTSTAATATSTARRGARSTPQPAESDSDGTDDEIGVIETKAKAKTTTGRPRGRPPGSTSAATGTGRGRKPAAATVAPPKEEESDSDDDDELARMVDAPKKRVGRPKTKQPVKEKEDPKPEPVARTRGRPKGSTNKTTKTATASSQKDTTTKTRSKAVADTTAQAGPKEIAITTNSSIMKSNLLRGPAKKKTVTFRDPSDSDDDSEPSPPPPAGRRRPAAAGRATGLAAKPARKAPTPARGRKPAATKKAASKPLSPKKATQVAKSISSYASSDGEEDELSSAKSPIKLVVNSPQKHGSEHTGLSSPVKRINFTSLQSPKKVDENGEPAPRPRRSIDFNDTLMSSPARRPPPSPFNYTVRETPRRGGFALRDDPKPLAQPNFTPTQNSPLKLSPKKASLGTPRFGGLNLHDDSRALPSQPSFTPGQNSPLKSSPKKGIFGMSLQSQAPPHESSTPLKSRSLLMSPAKRVASPFKSSLFARSSPMVLNTQMENAQIQNSPAPSSTSAPHLPLQPLELEDEMEVEEPEEQQPAMEESAAEESDAETSVEHADSDLPEAESGQLEAAGPELIMDDLNDEEEASQTEPLDDMDDQPEDSSEDEEVEHNTITLNMEALEDGIKDCPQPNTQTPADDIITEDETATKQQDSEDETEAPEHAYASSDKQDPDNAELGQQSDVEVVQEAQSLPEDLQSEHGEDDNSIETDTAPLPEIEIDNLEQHTAQEPTNEQVEEVEPRAEQQPEEQRRQSWVEGLEDPFTDEPHDGEAPVISQETEDEDEKSVFGVDEATEEYSRPMEDDENEPTEMIDGEALAILDITQRNDSPAEAFMPYEVEERRESSTQAIQEYVPPAPSPPMTAEYRESEAQEDSTEVIESNVEITMDTSISAHNEPSPLPITYAPQSTERRRRSGPRFTLLAEQLSGWKASSPEKSHQSRPKRRGVFSLGGNLKRQSDVTSIAEDVAYPELPTQNCREQSVPEQDSETQAGAPQIFEDYPEDHHEEPDTIEHDMQENDDSRPPLFEIFSDPQVDIPEGGAEETPATSSKGHESPVCLPPPTHEVPFDDEKENQDTLLPAPNTPAKIINPMRTLHTVSKVPLKPEGQISPLKMPRKRGRSLSITSPVRSSPRIRKSILAPREPSPTSPSPRKSSRPRLSSTPQLPPPCNSRTKADRPRHSQSKAPARSPSPSKSPRKSIGASQQVLGGAVVFVDVHTTEGEDASGIFVELLQQMGARCVRNWAWNPRASVSHMDENEPKDGRIGITHVVYKDGGVRTLEKVRQARGVVKCVGVGWVLDCERENKWIDEAHYAVDSSIIPRGGAKRRKSMEPRALSNVNGTLVKSNSTSSRRSGADRDTMQSFMRQTPPLRDESASASSSATPESARKFRPSHTEADQRYCQSPPKTPGYDFSNLDRIGMSPATPFYLSQRNRLVQQTCPPKQTREGLFSAGRPNQADSQPLRAKLEAARRKSLAFKPRVGSPLIE